MRGRLVKPQTVTVRPMVEQVTDVLGDVSAVPSSRSTSLVLPMQVTWTNSAEGGPGYPGRTSSFTAIGMALKRDIGEWTPKAGDLVVMPDGRSLFVHNTQPAFPRARRIGVGDSGGFDGWRLGLMDRLPTQDAAANY